VFLEMQRPRRRHIAIVIPIHIAEVVPLMGVSSILEAAGDQARAITVVFVHPCCVKNDDVSHNTPPFKSWRNTPPSRVGATSLDISHYLAAVDRNLPGFSRS
jgi:hypothetical protein